MIVYPRFHNRLTNILVPFGSGAFLDTGLGEMRRFEACAEVSRSAWSRASPSVG
jgi:hypothetical protein